MTIDLTEITSDTPDFMHERGYVLAAEFDDEAHFRSKEWIIDAPGPYRATTGDRFRVWAAPECGYTGVL